MAASEARVSLSPSHKNHSVALKYVFGGMSCMAGATVTNPIDVAKTRLQIQGELGCTRTAKAGMTRTIINVARQEGVLALWKGLAPSLLREATYSTIRMGSYEPFKELVVSFRPEAHRQNPELALTEKILAGCGAGAVGASLTTPTDLIKVRMQTCTASAVSSSSVPSVAASMATQSKKYRGLWHAFTEIIEKEGVRRLYRGTLPNVQRAVLLTGSQLPSYDHFKHWALRNNYMSEGISLHFLSSVVAGLACAIVTAPIDNVKTRIMNQPVCGVGNGLKYQGVIDCFSKTVRHEGILGLYKGFLPQWMRIGPHTVVSFLIFEQLRKAAGLRPV